jgi:hypothetical protein
VNAIQFRFSVTLYKHTYACCTKITIGNDKKKRAGFDPALRGWSVLDGEPRRERDIRRVAQRPSSETVAPGGWGAKCPEPVGEARPRATVISIAFQYGRLWPLGRREFVGREVIPCKGVSTILLATLALAFAVYWGDPSGSQQRTSRFERDNRSDSFPPASRGPTRGSRRSWSGVRTADFLRQA